MKEKRIIYYSDELNEEFSKAKITPRAIDENYVYIHKSSIWNACSFVLQNILSMPIKILYSKLKFKLEYVGKEKLKAYKKDSYFVYANHTQSFADTFIPTVPMYPKRGYLIVNPENVSMKFLENIVQMLGAIPIPNNRNGMENFLKAIKDKVDKGHAIVIYPEAHIWPYYTKIRPFSAVSFKYPVEYSKPVFCVTNTYKAYGKNKDKVKIVSYIDGPFFADTTKSPKIQRQELRDAVYNCMVERSKNSDIEYIIYRKKEEGKENKNE